MRSKKPIKRYNYHGDVKKKKCYRAVQAKVEIPVQGKGLCICAPVGVEGAVVFPFCVGQNLAPLAEYALKNQYCAIIFMAM